MAWWLPLQHAGGNAKHANQFLKSLVAPVALALVLWSICAKALAQGEQGQAPRPDSPGAPGAPGAQTPAPRPDSPGAQTPARPEPSGAQAKAAGSAQGELVDVDAKASTIAVKTASDAEMTFKDDY